MLRDKFSLHWPSEQGLASMTTATYNPTDDARRDAAHPREFSDFAWTPENAEQANVILARYPEARRAARRSCRCSGSRSGRSAAETRTQAWLPIPVIEYRRRADRHAVHARLRGRDLLHDVQPRRRSAATTSRCAGRRRACCAARTTCSRACHDKGLKKGGTTARRAVHPDRGRMPRRLRQRADGPDQRRQLRGPRL